MDNWRHYNYLFIDIMEKILWTLSPLCWVLAALCNAVMDTVADRPNFNNSIFNGLGSWWSYKKDTAGRKYVDGNQQGERRKALGGLIDYPVQLLDPWHHFKMWTIVLQAVAIVTFPYTFKICLWGNQFVQILLWIGIYGLLWNKLFSWGYHRFFSVIRE